MYHRHPSASRPGSNLWDETPPPPVVGRHPLPPAAQATTLIARFVMQVFVLSTAAGTAGAWLRTVWPNGLLFLLALCGVGMLLLAGLKWLWGGRVSGLPAVTTTVFAVGILWLLGALAGHASSMNFLSVAIAAYVFAGAVAAARFADEATMWQDWRTSLFLGVGALLLLAVNLISLSPTAVVVFVAAVGIANVLLAIGVCLTYVEYLLSNPFQPLAAIQAARARWAQILKEEQFEGQPGTAPPTVLAATLIILIILFAVLFAAIPHDKIPALSEIHPTNVALLVIMFGLPPTAAAAWLCCRNGRLIFEALVVWMLYGERSPALPAIFRPYGWLGTARARQLCVAALVFGNVAVLRLLLPTAESLLAAAWKSFADAGQNRGLGLLPLAAYALLAAAPLLVPLQLLALFIRRDVGIIYDMVEAAEPHDLYAASGGGKP